MGGIAFRAPVLATLFLIVSLATLAMPGSSNFVGEFLILLGVFKAKLVIAIIAFSGVVMASVYALRLFIRSMHNRVGPRVRSCEIKPLRRRSCSCRSSRVIVFLALYPQLALHRSERSVKTAVAPPRRRCIRHRRRWRRACRAQRTNRRKARPDPLKNGPPANRKAQQLKAPKGRRDERTRTNARDGPSERPARRLRRALAADRAAGRRGVRAARRAARLALGAHAARAGVEPRRARRGARPDDLAVERRQVDRLGRAARRRPVADR